MTEVVQEILFSDCFQVDKQVVKDYGAFNVSLLADLPLFIDPFLLFNSGKSEYKKLHDEIIQYLNFLREKSVGSYVVEGDLEAYYHFKEVRQTWLGFTLSGNRGSGLGPKFARALNENLHRLFSDEAAEKITEGRHLEKLCLFGQGVGRDNISDFTTNLIKDYLLTYTQTFAKNHLKPDQLRNKSVEKARFNYRTESWQAVSYCLPYYHDDYVLLVPQDMLTCDDTWINRNELLDDFEHLPEAIPDIALRAEVNNYFIRMLPEKPKGKEPNKQERREAAQKTIREFPELIDYFIKFKEENGDGAVFVSDEWVNYAQSLFLENFTRLASLLAEDSDFYSFSAGQMEDAVMRANCLKEVVELKDGYQFFYDINGEAISREHDLRIAHRFCWLGVPKGMATESTAPFPVEFKLASNKNLKHFFSRQIEESEKTGAAPSHVNVIFCFSEWEKLKLAILLKELDLSGKENIIVVDAQPKSRNAIASADTSSAKALTSKFDRGYALVIGVADYPNINKLSEAVLKDAKDIRDVLCSPIHCGYADDHVRLLLNEQATAEGIREGFAWLASATGPDDTAVIFFSGHGGRLPMGAGMENFLMPYDTMRGKIPSTAIAGQEVTEMLRGIQTQRLLVFFDSCFSGGTGEPKDDEAEEKGLVWGLADNYYAELAQGTGRVIMAASRQDEPSYILTGMTNSLFTHFLLEALRGNVRSRGDGLIRVFEVFEYVSEKVPARYGSQHPIFKATDLENNFAVSLFKGSTKAELANELAIPQTRVNKTQLRQEMVAAFTNAELEELCTDLEQEMQQNGHSLSLNLEIIGGEGKVDRILKLIDHMDRRKMLGFLVTAVRRVRPGII